MLLEIDRDCSLLRKNLRKKSKGTRFQPVPFSVTVPNGASLSSKRVILRRQPKNLFNREILRFAQDDDEISLKEAPFVTVPLNPLKFLKWKRTEPGAWGAGTDFIALSIF